MPLHERNELSGEPETLLDISVMRNNVGTIKEYGEARLRTITMCGECSQ